MNSSSTISSLERDGPLSAWARLRAAARFVRLPPADQLATVRVGAVATAVEAGLRRRSLPALAERLGLRLRLDHEPPAEPSPPPPRLSARERRQLDAVDRVLRHWPFGDTCLRRALVAGHLLGRRRPELLVGVARDGDDVHAHAWLAIDGATLFDRVDRPYRTLHRVSSSDPT